MTRNERQEICIKNWVKHKGRGLVLAATGFGKTFIGLKAINRFLDKNKGKEGISILILVPTNPLKKQWESIILKHIGKISFIEVSTYASIVETNKEIKTSLLIMDECHRVVAPSYINCFKQIKFNFFLGLTATLERLDLRHLILTKHFPIVDEIPLETCLKYGWVAPAKIYKVLIEVDDIGLYKLYSENFEKYFSYFNHDFKFIMKFLGKEGYKNREQFLKFKYSHLNPEKLKEMRQIFLANLFGFSAELKNRKNFIYNHPKKIEICNKILNHRKNKKTIVFAKTIAMANKVKPDKDINVYSADSSKTKKKNSITIEDFNAIPTGVLKVSKIADEGIDIAGLNTGIIIGFDSSKLTSIQKIGRIIRAEENKKAELFVLVIKETVEDKWFESAFGNKDYEVIDEEQLNNVLQYKEYITMAKKESKFSYRF